MNYIGIDPGKKGALAVIAEDGSLILRPFDKRAYIDVLAEYGDFEAAAVVCLEHVGAMPGQGVTSMFSFGENFGWLQGVLDAYGIRYELVRPQKWKKEYSITADKTAASPWRAACSRPRISAARRSAARTMTASPRPC